MPLLAQPQDPRFVRLTRDHGLSDNNVEAIIEDRRGFMWFGTTDGLDRYDGHDVVTYRHDPQDPASLSDSYVLALHVDRRGRLWIGTTNGLNRYQPETDAFVYYLEDGNPGSTRSSTVYVLADAEDGGLWVGGARGVDRYDPESDRFTGVPVGPADPADGTPESQVFALLVDRRGDLWVGTETQGLSRRDARSGRFRHYRHDPRDASSLPSDQTMHLTEGGDGTVWVSTLGGLARYDPAADAFVRYRHDPEDPTSLGGDAADPILVDRDGVVWVGSTDGRGVSRLDPATGRCYHLRHSPNNPATLGADTLRHFFEDSRGDLWIGTYTGGVSFWNRDTAAFGHYRHDPMVDGSLSHNGVNHLLETHDGTLWIATEDGVNRLDEATGTFEAFRHDERDPTSLSAKAALSLLEDSRGNFWVGTWLGGVNHFDRRRGTFKHFKPDPDDPTSLGNPHVFGLFEDRQGRVWLGHFGGADRYQHESGTFIHYRYDPEDPHGLRNEIVWNFYEDSAGTLWLSTPGGLSRYVEEEDNFRTFVGGEVGVEIGEPTTLLSTSILAVYEDSAGRFWVGTEGGGLGLLDRETGDAVSYTTADGLANDIVFAVLEGDPGVLWLATNDGISSFDVATETFSSYGRGDGVLAGPFKRNGFLKLASGEILFGGAGGVSRFTPSQVRTNPHRPPVVITDFKLANRKAPFGGPEDALDCHVTEASQIVLRPEHNVFSLSFAALNYRNPQRNRYAYRLEGFQDEWVEAGTENTATYTNLDPGSYTFHVRGANNSGLWNQEGASIDLVVLPHTWETWWFRTLCALLAGAVLLAFYRLRVDALHARADLLEKEAARAEVLAKEIAERHTVEAEREQLIRELEAKNSELEHFSRAVSHDLKAPLVTIAGFADLLEKDARAGDAEKAKSDAAAIKSAIAKMRALLEELLALSRLGRKIRAPEPTALADLAREAAGQLAGIVAERGVELRIEEDMPAVMVDRLRMSQVFQNLIGNAVRFMGEQESPVVEVGARADGEEVVCHVRDNGIGIAEEDQAAVFEPFQRLETGTEGTGLGLPIVKRIVEVHGGRIWIESEGAGSGTTFYFTIPGDSAPTAER